jgi:tripeptidyl-peptidase-1
MVLVAVLLTSLFALAISQPMTRRSLVVHEKRTVAPTGFISLGAAPRDASINLRIGLFSKDIEGLERVLYDVSTPSSPQYGQHLNRDEVRMEWLLRHEACPLTSSSGKRIHRPGR